jgi:peptidylprolyl isomerase
LRSFAFTRAAALLALAAAVASAGCSSGGAGAGTAEIAADAPPPAPRLQITDRKIGTGLSPRAGQICVVHYTGWLYNNGVKGKKFDSSVDRKRPFSFTLGAHKVIEGWEQGVRTMKVGGKRTLIVPPELGYGSAGGGPAIPPNSTLLFEIELLGLKLG